MLSGLLFSCIATAQNVSGYAFAQATETYTAVSGTPSAATGDDGTDNAIPFGFSFPFGGSYYTTFSISVNGFIRLGNDIGGQNWTNALGANAPQRPLIAAFWDDHNAGTGSINYSVTGSFPNRIVEVGWDNINPSGGGGTSATAFGSFKMRLFETSGIIEFVYGSNITAVNAFSASIGLNDDTTFLSVTPGNPNATTSPVTANNAVDASANLIGKKYIFTPPSMCSSMPSPGITIAPASVCSDVIFELSVQNIPAESGISYQWQSSADGVAFSDIQNANGPTLQTTQTSATYYHCLVSCGAQTATTTATTVNMNAASQCYCSPVYGTGMTDGDLISHVEIPGTTLSNETGTEPVNPYYTYFSGQPNYTAELMAGGNYELHVTVGTYGQQHSTAWIDYNDDGFFTEDERIGFSDGEIGSLETAIYTIQLACDAPAGVHRLRIRDVWNNDSSTIDPCAEYGYGEVEDYDITIVAGESCPMPFGLNVASVNSSSGIFSWNSGCGQTSWNVYVVASGGTTPTNNPTYTNVTSPFVFSNLDAETVYDIYVQGNCDANGLSDWAGPFTFTTAPMAVANDDCGNAFSLQVGGVFEDYSITATNSGATKTLGEPNVTCAAFAFGGDVWFSAVVPASGTLTFETQAEAGSSLSDTGMSAYSGTCGGGLTSLGCSDDNGSNGFSIVHLTNLTPGTTVYARVWEYANDVVGTFKVSAYDASLGVHSLDSAAFRYYPNPVKNTLNVSYDENISDVTVMNLLGQNVLHKSVNETNLQLDLSSLPSGNYLVKITSGNASKTIKVIKE